MIWRLKFHISLRTLMYVVGISRLLLTPLQAAFSGKVFCLLSCALYIPQCNMWEGYHPTPHLLLFLPPSLWQQTPCPCFRDSTVASNELRRTAPQEEWQPLVMFSTTSPAALKSHPLLNVSVKPQIHSISFSSLDMHNSSEALTLFDEWKGKRPLCWLKDPIFAQWILRRT